jgi:hypothetical protein
MKRFLLLIFLFCILNQYAIGQTIIFTQGFETNLSGYSHSPSQEPSADPGDQYFHRAEPSNSDIYETGGDGPYTNVTGSWLFVGSNPNTINGGSDGILTLGGANVAGFTDLELSADFGAVPNDWDTSDDLRVEYNFDGGAWTTLYSFDASGTNTPISLSGNAAGGTNTANGTTLTYALTTIISDNFTGSGSILNIRIVCDAGANYEAFGVDNIQLRGVAPSSPVVGFDNNASSQNESNSTFSTLIPVSLSNYGGAQVDLSVAVTGGTAEVSDYTLNTSSLSFTADGTMNISIDINDDADTDDETVELTITETTATGTTISTAVHTLTIIDDEMPVVPQVVITEVGDPADNASNRMVEICNRGNTSVDITGWSLQGDFNGNTNVDFTVSVTGSVSLGAGECFVFANNSFGVSLATCVGSESSGNINSNGDETFWLNNGSTQIDIYDGQTLGFTDAIATRNGAITSPNATFTASEWTVASGNTADLTPCTDATALPIELTYFQAQKIKQQVLLSWETAIEINNDYMAIERSKDGRTFQEMGSIQGAGTTNTPQRYTYLDENPFTGTNYYRLRQVDFDGRATYHEVVAVNMASANQIRILPNPVNDFTTLQLTEVLETEGQILIYDMMGKVAFEARLAAGQSNVEIDLSFLANGSYIIRLELADGVVTERFVKQ